MRRMGIAMLVAVLTLFAAPWAYRAGQAAGIHARAAPAVTVAQQQPAELLAMYAVLSAADDTMREPTYSQASADRMPLVYHERRGLTAPAYLC